MEFKQALDVANALVFSQARRHLNDVEILIFKGSWHKQTYEQIAEAEGYSSHYLARSVAPKFWRLLSQALGESVSKTNFRSALERQWRVQQENLTPSEQNPSASLPPLNSDPEINPLHSPTIDWGEAIDVRSFRGRTEELATLENWVVRDRCRLITLLGMGGVGKSSLAAKLMHQFAGSREPISTPNSAFDLIIWRSLRNAPSLETLLADLILFLSQEQETQSGINQLLHYLRSSHCLIILDNLETIFQEGDRTGHYRAGYENYAELWQIIGKTAHQSCVILTSREKPLELLEMEGMDAPVRSLQLSGSLDVAQAILQSKALVGSQAQRQTLSERYSYNPLALKVVSSIIQELFDSDIELFLEQNTTLFNSVHRLLEQQFERLSYLEQSIMYWLAINREWTTIADLADDIIPVVSRAQLLEGLESLKWRSLIETQSGRYTQQPVVMEYVCDRLVEKFSTELITRKLSTFHRYPLLKTTVKDYVKESQSRLVLSPVAVRFNQQFTSTARLAEHISLLLTTIRQSEFTQAGYSAGNLMNVLIHLGISLSHYDFSHLTLRQADLSAATLHHVNFTDATFIQTAFMQTLGNVFSVAISPDGLRLASGELSGKIHLWRLHDTQLLTTLEGHHNWWVWALSWSPNGRMLASGSVDQSVRLWDAITRSCIHVLSAGGKAVWKVAWSPDSTLLASTFGTCEIAIWDVQTGAMRTLLQGHRDVVRSIAWRPNGQTLVTGSDDQTVQLWDACLGQRLHASKDLESGATDPIDEFCQNGSRPVTPDVETDIRESCLHLNMPKNIVWAIAWNPNGHYFAIGSDDGMIRIWDAHTLVCIQEWKGHSKTITTIAWGEHPHQTIATSSADQTIRIWEWSTGKCLKLLQGHQGTVWSISWHCELQRLVSGSDDKTIRIWDTLSGKCLKTLQGFGNPIFSLCWMPGNGSDTLVSGSGDHRVRLWNVERGECSRVLEGHTSGVWTVACSSDGRYLVSGDEHHIIKLWNLNSGEYLKNLIAPGQWVRALAWSPDNSSFASSSEDQTIRIWNAKAGECLHTLILEQESNRVLAIAWHPEFPLLASGSTDNLIRLWDLESKQCVAILNDHQRWVWSLAWSLDGKQLVSGSGDHTIRLWDISWANPHTPSEIRSRVLGSHDNSICTVVWHPSKPMLASSSMDQTIRLWDRQTGQCLKTLEGHRGSVWSLAWNWDGTWLASGGEDETIKIWDIQTGMCLKTMRADRPYENMNITGATGLTDAQKATLKVLGAIEQIDKS